MEKIVKNSRVCCLILLLLFPQLHFAQIKISGSTTFTINNGTTITVSGPSDSVIIASNGLMVNNGKIILDTAVIVYEALGNPIIGDGFEEITRNFSSSVSNINIGGLGGVLTTSVSPGITTVRRGHLSLYDSLGNPGIKRWIKITSSNNSMLNANLIFKYDSIETNEMYEPELLLHISYDNGTKWINKSGIVNANSNSIEISNLDSLGLFTAFIPNIYISNVLASEVCPGDTLFIPYTSPQSIKASNIFTVQLSDGSGNFSNPLDIGTKASNISDTIMAIIPLSISPDSNYRVRVISSDIPLTGMKNPNDIIIGSLPLTPVSPLGAILVCNVNADVYSVTTSSDALDYNWYINPTNAGNLIASYDTVTVNWNNTYNGPVTLSVKAVNDCGESVSEGSLDINVTVCTGLTELDFDFLNIAPNPANNQISVRSGKGFKTYRIFSSVGEIVKSGKLMPDNTTKIDLNLSPGAYFIEFSGNNINKVEKLIIQ